MGIMNEEDQPIYLTEISGDEGKLSDFKTSLKICFKKPQIREWIVLYVGF